MKIPDALETTVGSQDGLVTRAQVHEAGVTVAALRHATRKKGPWQRVAPGVYATFTGTLSQRQVVRATLLYAGSAAIVTGAWACRAFGLRYVPKSPTIEVLLPHHVFRRPLAFATFRRTRHVPAIVNVRGIPCADPSRAVLDAVRDVDALRDARAAICELVQRGLATEDELTTAINTADGRGLTHARRAVKDVRSGCRSAPECEVRDLMATSATLPEFVWNEPLPSADGEPLVPDACLEEARLVLEIDSIEWHQLGDGPDRTERRRARYAALGWTVLPIVPSRVRGEPEAVLAEIEAAVIACLEDRR